MRRQSDMRSVLERYIGEIATNCEGITGTAARTIYDALLKQAKRKTREADAVLDEEGKVIGSVEEQQDVVIVEERQSGEDGQDFQETLFGEQEAAESGKAAAKGTRTRKKTRRRKVA